MSNCYKCFSKCFSKFFIKCFIKWFVWIKPLFLWFFVWLELKTTFMITIWLWTFVLEVHSKTILWFRTLWQMCLTKYCRNLWTSPKFTIFLLIIFIVYKIRFLFWTKITYLWRFLIKFSTKRKILTIRQVGRISLLC